MKPVGEGSVPKARDDDIGIFRKRRPGRTVESDGEDDDDRENELEDVGRIEALIQQLTRI
jgi:hypothetical protein